jgi:hypothetical protein
MKPTRFLAAPSEVQGALTVRVLTDLTERQQFEALLETEHFLGSRFPAGDRLYQVAEQDGQWVGLLLWCVPALHLKDRDAWIGWDPLTRAQRLKLIVNQARFLIPEAARRPNLASPILAAATAALPDQWLAHCGYAPLLAEPLRDQVRDDALLTARAAGLAIEHLERRNFRKEDRVTEVLQKRGDAPGLAQVFWAMEACQAFKP